MFRDVIGHQQNIESLQNTLTSGYVSGSYLFAGPDHVGKEFTAMMFAKAVFCRESVDDACGRCVACRKVEDGNHPDMRLIHPQGSWMKIDQIRAMQRELNYRPMEGHCKVYILTQAERLTVQAANSMLKTLEEPPGEAVMILITSKYDAILPTIRSRCRALKFARVPVATLSQALVRRAMLPDSLARQYAILSAGNVAKALEMATSNEEVVEPQPPAILSGIEPLQLFREAEALQKQPEQIDVLLTWYRDLLMVKQQAPMDLLTYAQASEALRQIVQKYTSWQIQQAIQWIQETKTHLQHNVNSALALEVLLIRLANLNARGH